MSAKRDKEDFRGGEGIDGGLSEDLRKDRCEGLNKEVCDGFCESLPRILCKGFCKNTCKGSWRGFCKDSCKDLYRTDPSIRCLFMADLYERFGHSCGRSAEPFQRQSLIGILLM
jgi:hypothetical protein